MDSLDKHSRESEKVQFAATAAVETASRAREQITNSLDLIRELKSRLDQFSSNDVLTVRDRIISLRNSARDALEAAENAKNRALDLKIPTDVQTVDNARVLRMAQEIENESTVNLKHVLFNNLYYHPISFRISKSDLKTCKSDLLRVDQSSRMFSLTVVNCMTKERRY